MPEQVPPGEYEDIVMPEQHRHLANKCEDIVNLQVAEAYCVATRTACLFSAAMQQPTTGRPTIVR